MNKEKIKGMFSGCQIGDCLGLPVETWSAERIANNYGRLERIIESSEEQPTGLFSDDCQLTIAVAEAMIASKGLDLDKQAEYHVNAFKESTLGWGSSTRKSVENISNGMHWSKSGFGGEGKGNGVAMKIAPVGAYASTNDSKFGEAIDFTMKLSLMTHQTSIAASAALAQMAAVSYCLQNNIETFDPQTFVFHVCSASSLGELINPETIDDNITERLELLYNYQNYDTKKIISEFNGSCYSYNSIPFTMMFFLKDYKTINSLYNVVNAGGDCDSNASMLGTLLGALHGASFFPNHLIDALNKSQRNKVLSVANDFYECFKGI